MTNHINDIEQFDLSLSKIIGKHLGGVYYYEIKQDKPYYDYSNYHRVDYGLELLVDNEKYYIVWNDKYLQFDIKFGLGSIGQDINIENEGVVAYKLNSDINWLPLIGQKIIDAKSIWNWVENIETKERNYYPKDICLKFEMGQTVLISCTSIENETYLSSADEVTIFFDPEIANKYGVGTINV